MHKSAYIIYACPGIFRAERERQRVRHIDREREGEAYVYLSMCTYAYIRTYLRTHVHTCTHAYIRTYLHIPTYILEHTYSTFTCLYVHIGIGKEKWVCWRFRLWGLGFRMSPPQIDMNPPM